MPFRYPKAHVVCLLHVRMSGIAITRSGSASTSACRINAQRVSIADPYKVLAQFAQERYHNLWLPQSQKRATRRRVQLGQSRIDCGTPSSAIAGSTQRARKRP